MFILINILLVAAFLMLALLIAASASMSNNALIDIELDGTIPARFYGQSGLPGGDESAASPTAAQPPHVAAAGMQ